MVFNSNNNKVISYSSDTSSFNGQNDDKGTTISKYTVDNENNLSPTSTIEAKEVEGDVSKESYSARFERLFGKKSNRTASSHGLPSPRSFTFSGTGVNFDLGSIFAKGREHFLKENSEARIDLLANDAPYSPGHTVKGTVILLTPQNQEKGEKESVRGMEITLIGIEHAFAQGLQRVTTTEKYKKI